MTPGKPIAITPALAAKVRSLHDYGITLHAIAARLDIAVASAHKILHQPFPACSSHSKPAAAPVRLSTHGAAKARGKGIEASPPSK